MIVVKCTQGSPEWHRARSGVITASMFRVARSRLKRNSESGRAGDFTDDAKKYAFQLAIERISGEPLEDAGFESWQMRRGHELEPAARLAHEVACGEVVYRAGFVTTDDGLFGGSADGLIGEEGGAEYKCLISPLELRRVYVADDWTKYLDQVHGCMMVSDRSFWELCVYCPALKPIGRELKRVRIERDEAYIRELRSDLMEFRGLVDQYEAALRL